MFGNRSNAAANQGEYPSLLGATSVEHRFSLPFIRKIHQQLLDNKNVNKHNEELVIEILRVIAEMVVYGDSKSELLFDFFCEKNMLSLFLELMWVEGGCPIDVHVQILQTLSILINSVKNDTSLYYLLSNNYINEMIVYPHDFSDPDNESLRDQFVSFMKSLSLRLNNQTVQFFFIEETGAFPLLSKAIEMLTFQEPMVRIAAQSTILNVFKVYDSRARDYALQDEIVHKFFAQVILLMDKQYNALQRLCSDAMSQCVVDERTGDLKYYSKFEMQFSDMVVGMEDWFYYLQDIFDLRIMKLRRSMVHYLLTEFIYPVLLAPLLSINKLNAKLRTTSSETSRTPTPAQSVAGTPAQSLSNLLAPVNNVVDSEPEAADDVNEEDIDLSELGDESHRIFPGSTILINRMINREVHGITPPLVTRSTAAADILEDGVDGPSPPLDALPAPIQIPHARHSSDRSSGAAMESAASSASSSVGRSFLSMSPIFEALRDSFSSKAPSTAAVSAEDAVAVEVCISLVVALTMLNHLLRIVSDKMLHRAVMAAVLHPLSRSGRKKFLNFLSSVASSEDKNAMANVLLGKPIYMSAASSPLFGGIGIADRQISKIAICNPNDSNSLAEDAHFFMEGDGLSPSLPPTLEPTSFLSQEVLPNDRKPPVFRAGSDKFDKLAGFKANLHTSDVNPYRVALRRLLESQHHRLGLLSSYLLFTMEDSLIKSAIDSENNNITMYANNIVRICQDFNLWLDDYIYDATPLHHNGSATKASVKTPSSLLPGEDEIAAKPSTQASDDPLQTPTKENKISISPARELMPLEGISAANSPVPSIGNLELLSLVESAHQVALLPNQDDIDEDVPINAYDDPRDFRGDAEAPTRDPFSDEPDDGLDVDDVDRDYDMFTSFLQACSGTREALESEGSFGSPKAGENSTLLGAQHCDLAHNVVPITALVESNLAAVKYFRTALSDGQQAPARDHPPNNRNAMGTTVTLSGIPGLDPSNIDVDILSIHKVMGLRYCLKLSEDSADQNSPDQKVDDLIVHNESGLIRPVSSSFRKSVFLSLSYSIFDILAQSTKYSLVLIQIAVHTIYGRVRMLHHSLRNLEKASSGMSTYTNPQLLTKEQLSRSMLYVIKEIRFAGRTVAASLLSHMADDGDAESSLYLLQEELRRLSSAKWSRVFNQMARDTSLLFPSSIAMDAKLGSEHTLPSTPIDILRRKIQTFILMRSLYLQARRLMSNPTSESSSKDDLSLFLVDKVWKGYTDRGQLPQEYSFGKPVRMKGKRFLDVYVLQSADTLQPQPATTSSIETSPPPSSSYFSFGFGLSSRRNSTNSTSATTSPVNLLNAPTDKHSADDTKGKRHGDLLFVQDKSLLIICKPVFENAKAGFNVFLTVPLMHAEASISRFDKRLLNIVARSWDSATNLDKVGSDPADYNKSALPNSSSTTFLPPRKECCIWKVGIGFEAEQACALAMSHIQSRRQTIRGEKKLLLKMLLEKWSNNSVDGIDF